MKVGAGFVFKVLRSAKTFLNFKPNQNRQACKVGHNIVEIVQTKTNTPTFLEFRLLFVRDNLPLLEIVCGRCSNGSIMNERFYYMRISYFIYKYEKKTAIAAAYL